VSFVDTNRDELGFAPICTALQVAPSTYYAAKSRPLSARAIRDAMMGPVLLALWVSTGSCTGRTSCGKHPAGPATTSAGTR